MKKLAVYAVVIYLAWTYVLKPRTLIPRPFRDKACPCPTCPCDPCEGKCDKSVETSRRQSEDHVGGPEWDGREVQVDLPGSEHLKNKGGSDGLGLCVFTSIDHAARWQDVGPLVGFRDFMTKHPGGGYPSKVDEYIPKKTGGVKVDYVQFETGDPKALELALATGRMPCVTYGYSPRYGSNIAHMVNLVHLDEKWACILDNNFPGVTEYEWVERKEFLRRWNLGGGGWAVVLLNSPPPPVPHN